MLLDTADRIPPALTAEQAIIRDLDQAWTDRLRLEAQFAQNLWHSWEDRYNAGGYLDTALRTIDACRKELDALRAELDEFEARVNRLAVAAATVGDPLLTALGYLAHGTTVLPPSTTTPPPTDRQPEEHRMQIGPRTILFHDPDTHTVWERRINDTDHRFMTVRDGRGELRAVVWRIEAWGSLTPVHVWPHTV